MTISPTAKLVVEMRRSPTTLLQILILPAVPRINNPGTAGRRVIRIAANGVPKRPLIWRFNWSRTVYYSQYWFPLPSLQPGECTGLRPDVTIITEYVGPVRMFVGNGRWHRYDLDSTGKLTRNEADQQLERYLKNARLYSYY